MASSTLNQSRSIGVQQTSSSQGQWRQLLQEVKVLYLGHRYKQCAAQATELLRHNDGKLHALHGCFLHYYAAASYESLGHIAHNFSTNKLPLLYMAKDSYASCDEALGIAYEELEEHHQLNAQLHEESDTFSETSTCLRYSESTNDPPRTPQWVWDVAGPDNKGDGYQEDSVSSASNEDTPFHDASSSSSSDRDGGDDNTPSPGQENLMPPPLRIQKMQPEYPQPLSLPKLKQSQGMSRPLLEPPVNAKVWDGGCTPSRGRGTASGFANHPKALPLERLRDDADSHDLTRIIKLISSLSLQVTSNINRVCDMIKKTAELQRIHRATKNHRMASFWSFTPVFENKNSTNNGKGNQKINSISGSSSGSNRSRSGSSTNTRSTGRTTVDDGTRQRIEKLRAEGWKTVGIRSPDLGWKGAQYYEQLCGVALAELYDGY